MNLRSTLYIIGLAGTTLLLGLLIRPTVDQLNLAQIGQSVETANTCIVDESILTKLYQAIFYRPLDEEAKTHISKPLSVVLSDIINSQEHIVYSGLLNSVKSLEEVRRSGQDIKTSDESKYKNLIDSALSTISVWSETLPKKASGSFIIGPEQARTAIQKAYDNMQPQAQKEAQFGLFQSLNKIGTPASISLPNTPIAFSPAIPVTSAVPAVPATPAVPAESNVSRATPTPTITTPTPSVTASASHSPTPTPVSTPTPTPLLPLTVTITSATPDSPIAPNSHLISSINVQWDTTASNLNYKKIWRKFGSGEWMLVGISQPNNFYDLNIGAGTYSYKVSACSSDPSTYAAPYDCGPDSNIMTTTLVMGDSGSDTTPPSKPTNLYIWHENTSRDFLSWTTSTDDVGVVGYNVYVNGTYLKSVAGSPAEGGFQNDLSTTLSYTVAAYDAAGNVSEQSSPVIAP